MTTGQKIAARRKELELSQEALGDKLGVSRQTVYKWENDISLPDIDKLVALSRLFQVPVGWLLGVEEEPEPQSVDFSPEQLKLLEEILGRYQRAEPEELSEGQRKQVEELVGRPPKKRRRWPWVLAVLVIAVGAWTLFQRLDQMEQQYYDLANSVGNITYSVNSQIGSITDRVEEVLKAQNDLTADYGTQLVSADLASNTGTFSLRAVPKTYTPGMSVIFLADNGEETLEFPAQEGENGTFTGEAACTLTDTITLSAVFVTGDTRQTQLLDQYVDLYSDSLPQIDVNSLLSIFEVEEYDQGDGSFVIPEEYVTVSDGQNGSSVSAVWEQLGVSQLRKVEVGLFYNEKLVQWLTPCQKPSNYKGFEDEDFYRLDPVTLTMEEGDMLEIAARGTDQYGRQWVALGGAFQVKDGELTHPDSYAIFSDPAHWDFTT